MSSSNLQHYNISLLVEIQESIALLEQGKIPQVHQQLLEIRRKIRASLQIGGIWLFEPNRSLLDVYVESLHTEYDVKGFFQYQELKIQLQQAFDVQQKPLLLICSLTNNVQLDLLPYLSQKEHEIRLFLTSGNIESLRLYKGQVSARLIPKPFSIQFLHALVEQEIRMWEMSVCGFI